MYIIYTFTIKVTLINQIKKKKVYSEVKQLYYTYTYT